MSRAADLALRAAGALVAVVAAVATAVLAAFLSPLYLGTVRLPLAVLVAVVANYALVWFAFRVTGHRLVALLPGLVWIGTMIRLAAPTTEGDMVLTGNNWVGLGAVVAGVAAYAVAGFRLFNPPRDDPPALGPW